MSDVSEEQKELFSQIIIEVKQQVAEFEDKELSRRTLGDFWFKRAEDGVKRLEDMDTFINFRRYNLLVFDLPYLPDNKVKRWIFNCFMTMHKYFPFINEYRAEFKSLYDAYNFIKVHNLEDLLKDNPTSKTGNPYLFKKGEFRYTRRWIRHIYFLSLFKKHLEPQKDKIKTIMDIGSSWGTFPHIIKKNYPDTRFLLVDLPEQLALAHYYLKTEMPDCRIATYKDIEKVDKITPEFMDNYDFVLVPCFDHNKIAAGTVDLVTNFASLCEMSKEWFNMYVQSEAFKTSKFFFIWNSVIKEKNPGGFISLLDYPFAVLETMYFNNSPLLWTHYRHRKIFNCIPSRVEMFYHEPFFEYIGKNPKVL